MRAMGCSLTICWLRPSSPKSRIFSSSAIIGSGVELWTGKIPTDWPRIQSSSKLRMVSTAVRRSTPLPITSIRFFEESARIEPGFVAKLSRSFVIVCTETCRKGTTETP